MLTNSIRFIGLCVLLTLMATSLVAQLKYAELETIIGFEGRQQFDSAASFLSNILINQPNNKEALFHRSCCERAVRKTDLAIADLSAAIGLDSTYQAAFYLRANIFFELKRYEDALRDVEILVRQKEDYDGAVCLRGRIHSKLGHKKEACEDFHRAIELGSKAARKYKNEYCGNEQGSGESLMLYWPEDENWKVANSQDTKEKMVLELVRNNESLDKWTEMAAMISNRSISKSLTTTENVMNALYQSTQAHASSAKLSVVERNDSTEFPWIIFSVEAPTYDNEPKPESWLWYVVLGKDAVYMNFRALHTKELPVENKTKWTNFFKTGKILYK